MLFNYTTFMVLLDCIFKSVMDYCNYKKNKETNIKTNEINVDPLSGLSSCYASTS